MENGAPTAIVVRSATCNVLARVNRYSLEALPLRQHIFHFVLLDSFLLFLQRERVTSRKAKREGEYQYS